jgi:hypothetical protein
VNELASGTDALLDLNEWFRNWASSTGVSVAAYYETKKTGGSQIVSKATANPNVLGCDPIAVEANHIEICKPSTHESQLYISVRALLKQLVGHSDATLLPSVEMRVVAPIQPPAPDSTALIPATGFVGVVTVNSDSATPALPAPSPSLEASAIALPEHPSKLDPELLTDYQFFTTQAPDDRRPLDMKLQDAGRTIETRNAQRKKERFAMSLRRYSAQSSSLARYTRLMSEVESRFNRHVQPHIKTGVSISEINQLVQSAVIDPTLKTLLAETSDVTASLVESALYYLTGNCHVRWDADKD